MKNRFLSIFLCLALVITTSFAHISVIADVGSYDVWDGSTVSTELEGSGTYADPYLIKSGADLLYFMDSAKKDGNYYSSKYLLLTNDIDLDGKTIPMIYKFSGILDGNGYEIKGIKITNTNSATTNVAFIQYLDGTVRNLTLTGDITSNGTNVGGFASSISTSGTNIINCVNNINVTGSAAVGGFVGNAYPGSETTLNIFSCVNNGTITATATQANAGGFIGYTRAYAKFNIYYSQNNGEVVTNGSYVGGFVGNSNSSTLNFKYCVNAGKISGTSAVGGVFGINNNNPATGSIDNCVNYGEVTTTRTAGSTANLGAIAGYYSANVSNTKIPVTNSFYCQDDINFASSDGDGQAAKTPLGTAKTKDEFSDGTVALALGLFFVQGEDYPELRTYASGKGTAANPYVIKTKEELIMLSQMVTVAQLYDYTDMAFELGNDIDLENDTRFVGIGNGYKSFKGDFDGKGYTVSGLNIGDGSGAYSAHPSGLGFFGVIGGTNERKISNLTVKGNVISTAATTTATIVGGLVGKNSVKLTISNCNFDGTVYTSCTKDANYPAASGIICEVAGALDIVNCSVAGKIDGYGRGGSLVGSLNGEYAVNITNSYSVAEVTGIGANKTTTTPTSGGLIGFIGNGTIRLNNSFFAGTAPAERSSGMGGPIINHNAGGTFEATNVYYLADSASEYTDFNVGVNKTAEEFKNGTVLALLNANGATFVQGSEFPKFEGQDIGGDSDDTPEEDEKEEEEDDGKTYVVWDGSVSDSLSGTGSDIDPFIIANGADLKYFADQVNEGNDYSGKHVKLTANIDLDKINFDPIGNRGKWFRGIFNGNGNTVKNLNIVSESTNGIGFFGACNNAKITNLTVKGKVKGTVCTTATPVAGLVAIVAGGSMENCAFIGTVYSSNATATFSNYPAASGLVCLVEGAYTIDRCYVLGKIDGYGRSGGLVGSVNGAFNLTVSNSYCDAEVTGRGAEVNTASPTAGGLIGFLNTGIITLENCYFVGSAPAPRTSGNGGPIINHFAGGTLNCINTYYDSNKNPVEEADGQKFGEAKTSAEFKDGTVLALLNDGMLNPAFEQGEEYPVIIPPVADDGTIRDRYIRKYTFDNHPNDIATFNSNPNKYQNDGYYIDTIDDEKRLGARLYNYGRYNNNAILAPSQQYANGEGYGTVYSANLGGVFSHVDISEIKSNAFYKFSVDAKVVDIESDVTVQIGLFRATGASTYGSLAFQDSEGNTYDTAIKTVKLTLDKKTDYKTYTVEISGAEIRSFLDNYSNNANVIYFGVYCPTFINKSAYKDVVGMALDNFVALETAIPSDYVPADSLPVVDILNDDYSKSYGEHLYNIIENSSFENELTGVFDNLPKGFSVKTSKDNAIFGQNYLSANAKNGTVKFAIPFNLTINKFYTLGISTRTSDDAEYRIFVSDSADGKPLYDVDDESLKFLIDKNSKDGEVVRNGIYFRNTMKTTATQYLVFEVKKGTVDFDEITLTMKSTTDTNRNYYENKKDVTITMYDPNTSTEKELVIPYGETVYDVVK